MPPILTPEQQARVDIDRQLKARSWQVQSREQQNLFAQRGVTIREFPPKDRLCRLPAVYGRQSHRRGGGQPQRQSPPGRAVAAVDFETGICRPARIAGPGG